MLTKPLQFGRQAETHTVPSSDDLTSFTSYREHTNTVLSVPVSGLFAGIEVLTAVPLMNQVF